MLKCDHLCFPAELSNRTFESAQEQFSGFLKNSLFCLNTGLGSEFSLTDDCPSNVFITKLFKKTSEVHKNCWSNAIDHF